MSGFGASGGVGGGATWGQQQRFDHQIIGRWQQQNLILSRHKIDKPRQEKDQQDATKSAISFVVLVALVALELPIDKQGKLSIPQLKIPTSGPLGAIGPWLVHYW
ncbi:hypothetical protein FOPE_12675 [Fonsecaea pedrosoi]|nr:hypothetical protein FOPE_12675 [Fonsecaea pedrosoi]